MTPQETIETLKIAIAEVEWNYPMGYAVAFENAIKSLKKQIPKKVTFHKGIYRCPSCNDIVVGGAFCKHCGQALLWESEE